MRAVPRFTRGLATMLAGVCALTGAGCGMFSEDAPERRGENAERPPQFREVTANLDCAVPIVPERELFIRDVGVVEDPLRTQWTGGSGDPRDGAWSFGRLMARMSGTVPPEDFVRGWLAHWETAQTVNGQTVPARTAILPRVIDAWPRRADGKLDLTRAPLRLLAIVSRVDLRDLSLGSAGEGRFVFGVLGPSGQSLPFTVILEYDLPAQTRADVKAWAQRWHELGTLVPGTAAYNDALQAVTDRFTAPNAAPGRPNGSALNQLRTNEIALASPWQLREFRLDATSGQLREAPVALTPAVSFKGSGALATFINDNTPLLMDGGVPAVPLELNGAPFRGAFSLADVAWTAPGIANAEARHRFALNTCDGCHLGETGTTFLHVSPRSPGQPAALSAFVTGTGDAGVEDPGGLVHRFNELERRATDLSNVLCEDVQPPTVALTAPAEGSFVRGTPQLTATASDDQAVSRVEFLDGAQLVGTAGVPPFSAPWNTLAVADGTHTLAARAFDTSGNVATSQPVQVTVDNTPPQGWVNSPRYNQESHNHIRGTRNIAAIVTDNVSGPAQVDYLVDGLFLGTTPASNLSGLPWDSTRVADGNHALGARAWDRAGNSANFVPMNVVVDNTPPSATLTWPVAGAQLSGTVTLTANASDAIQLRYVYFEVDGQLLTPFDTTAPFSATWDTTGKTGTHTIRAVAVDRAGNGGSTATVTVTVVAPVPTAAYDATLRVPVCGGTGGAGCASGTLLTGRGPLGPEPSAPNTLQGSCADGTAGTFHSDESLDQLRVVSVDGTPLARGKSVRVEASVWAFSTANQLDLYVAADAQAPVWTYLTTLTPPGAGSQVLSHTFTLPATGTLQAIRGRFRFGGSAAPCAVGSYDDHDDLAFRVQ